MILSVSGLIKDYLRNVKKDNTSTVGVLIYTDNTDVIYRSAIACIFQHLSTANCVLKVRLISSILLLQK